MTDRPYTDDDIRALAARLHATAAADTDISIRPAVERKWTELDDDVVDETCDDLVGLLDKAADISRWAVDLGADGLKPSSEHVDIGTADRLGVRIHFAFHPEMPEELRQQVIDAIRDDMAPDALTVFAIRQDIEIHPAP